MGRDHASKCVADRLQRLITVERGLQAGAERAPRWGGVREIDDAIRERPAGQTGVHRQCPRRDDNTCVADGSTPRVPSLRWRRRNATEGDPWKDLPPAGARHAVPADHAEIDGADDIGQRQAKELPVRRMRLMPLDATHARELWVASDSFYPTTASGDYRLDMYCHVDSSMGRLRAWLTAAAILIGVSLRGETAHSQSSESVPLLPLEQLLARPRVTSVQIDPSGKTLAVLERVGSHPAVVIYTTGPREDGFAPRRLGVAFQDTVRSVNNVRWSGDGRWLLILHDRGGDEGYHLLRVDPQALSTDGAIEARAMDLTPFAGAEVDLLATPADGRAIIASNHRDARVSDVYAIDLTTGSLKRIAANPGDVTVWAITPEGTVAGASAVRGDGMLEVRTPAGPPGAGWRVVYRAPPAERFTLLGAERGGRVLVARSNARSAAEAFVWLDAATGRVRKRMASSCRGFDAGTLVTTLEGTALGESCATSYRTFVPVSVSGQARLRAALGTLDHTTPSGLPARALEFESATATGSRLVFYSHAPTDPGRFLFYDTQRGRIDTAFAMRPNIDRRQLAPTSFHWFRARDGLRLSLLLTRSPVRLPGPANARQPAVVAVHGGPWSRDEVGYAGETQLLANRGYTVIQVNFRGSTGLGRATVDGAVGEFGGRMSDDLLDAIAWSVREANVDPARVCILGGSYGGFAALVGMTRDAAHYRCGIDYAGPFDLETLVRAFPPSWQPFLPRSWYRFVGNPDHPVDRERMRRVSPLGQLDKAKGPLLVVHGENDPRVRTDQALRVVTAWRNRGLPVTLLLAGNEGHSFNEESTSLAVNRAVERFLGEWLGGRVQPTVPSAITQTLEALQRAGERASAPPPPRD